MLKGKKALITGSSRGIGRSIALALAKQGADIVVTYFKHNKAAEETATEIRALGREVLVLQVQLAYKEQIDQLFGEIQRQFGHLDIFVSNAVSATLRPLVELPARNWDYILSVNLTAFFLCSLHALKLMEDRQGRIIGISSLGSRKCLPGYAALGVAKTGMETLARYMAVEWADKEVNVNIVCGGPVDTEALEAFQGTEFDIDELKLDWAAQAPSKRLGRPIDLAEVVAFLCSRQADWIRGQTIIVDGGLSLV